jgi:S1-C subfamily serine protease
VTFVGCSSCASSSYFLNSGDLFRGARKSFIKLASYNKVTITNTSSTSAIHQRHELELKSSASGFIVGHNKDITLVATSAHVCTILMGNQINHFISRYSTNDSDWELVEKNKFILNDYAGKKYRGVIIDYNIDYDICILGSSRIPYPALPISKTAPVIGEKYYNIAAPMGLWSKTMIPLFEGRFLGMMKRSTDREISYLFSIPTIGGSSGSPILNIYGQVVAVTHSAYSGFQHIAMATTHNQLKDTYDEAIKKLSEDYEAYMLIITLANI